jgi:hypothetical protein
MIESKKRGSPEAREVFKWPQAKDLVHYARSGNSNCRHQGILIVVDQQVRKLAGWGLTQNDRASFVGWSQSLISLGF